MGAAQVREGDRDPTAPPRPPAHTVIPPLPRVERAPDGTLDVPEDITAWKGSIFSIYSNAVADWRGSGYGALLMTPSVRTQGSLHPILLQKNHFKVGETHAVHLHRLNQQTPCCNSLKDQACPCIYAELESLS